MSVSSFAVQHRRLDTLLEAHLLDVVGADFTLAPARLRRWRRALDRHIGIEETRLLPHVPEQARWGAHVYRAEHERIGLLADKYALRLEAVAARPPRGARARRQAVLALLDAAHALRHVLEHHHEREEMALAHELSAMLLEGAWRRRS
ncbi:MAG: hypothetical protein ABFC67_10410 [Mizugakiibacter sp.]|uniref:hypothetical protein n=1 Tax=Mizugakiibacter sp. TaxID=1972610 RepID=UPI0031C76FEA|nr:hypothetical protein [Xanthomonadaceae bacterium]